MIKIDDDKFIGQLKQVIDSFAPSYAWFYQRLDKNGEVSEEELDEVRSALSNLYVEGMDDNGNEITDGIYKVGDVVAGFSKFIS